MIKNIKWLALVALVTASCSKLEEAPAAIESADGLPLTAGTANFSKYVALGNSLTAGFSDGALFIEGQNGSWSNLLAQKFKAVGGGEFKIPFMADNVGGFVGVPGFGPRLFFTAPATVAPVSGASTTVLSTILSGAFNNMGVPGAKSFHLLAAGYGNLANLPNANPYFCRFASAPNATILGDALAQSPTFFSLWIGNNDVLSYASNGGSGMDQTGNPNAATYGLNDITDPGLFTTVYTSIVTQFTANGAKGVVANIPDVTTVPYFTRVPTNALPGLPPANVAQLNQLFGGINAALAGAGLPPRFVTLVADDGNPATIESNPLLIVDDNPSPTYPNISAQITAALTPSLGVATATFLGGLYGKARHATNDNPATPASEQDFIVLPAGGTIGQVQASAPAPFNTIGVSFPMPDSSSLTVYEAGLVKTATTAYNATIASVASSKGLAFTDTNALLNQVAKPAGVSSNGFTVRSTYVTGGGFSLDGVHPSPRGYALIANEFIKSINSKYGSNLKGYDLGSFRIQFPGSL